MRSESLRPLTRATLLLSLAGTCGFGQATDAARVAARAPANAPAYMRHTYPAALAAPLPAQPQASAPAQPTGWQLIPNADGLLGIYRDGGSVHPRGNAFFEPLGSNGRSCATCHAPSSGMSLSTHDIRARFLATAGRDPLFAPVDGVDCPSKGPASSPAAHSLLLRKGLFRVFLPVPKQTNDLSAVGLPPHEVEFTVSVVHDPNGCNTDPAYTTHVDPVTQEVTQMVSVYRRPRMAANLKFTTIPSLTLGQHLLPNVDLVTGAHVVDPATGQEVGGNIMWDGREPTLESQAVNATLTHAQALQPPTAAQVAEIVAFENQVFAAQVALHRAGDLTGHDGSGAQGGPKALAAQPIAPGNFTPYDAWAGKAGSWREEERASIARGQALFNTRVLNVADAAGFNNANALAPVIVTTNPFKATCATCHNIPGGGAQFPSELHTLGIGGQNERLGGPAPSRDLPIFKVSCKPPYKTVYDGTEVLTNDPGLALITGRCADVGRRTVPQLRALSARAPYFSDGSAATLEEVMRFYDRRFGAGFTDQDVRDLVNFMRAL